MWCAFCSAFPILKGGYVMRPSFTRCFARLLAVAVLGFATADMGRAAAATADEPSYSDWFKVTPETAQMWSVSGVGDDPYQVRVVRSDTARRGGAGAQGRRFLSAALVGLRYGDLQDPRRVRRKGHQCGIHRLQLPHRRRRGCEGPEGRQEERRRADLRHGFGIHRLALRAFPRRSDPRCFGMLEGPGPAGPDQGL